MCREAPTISEPSVRYRVVIDVGNADPVERLALLNWIVTRLVEALRESPVPVTLKIEQDQ